MVQNLPNFTKIDIIRCLLKIDKPISRSELSRILDLGEGTVRSILDILKEKGFLESNKQGHSLSDKGKKISKIKIKKIDLNDFFPELKKLAVQIKNPDKKEKDYVLRDIAIKNGAEGAIILRYSGNKLKIFDADYKEDFSEIEKIFDLSENDIVVVASAPSYKLAEHSAIAVAIQLSSDLKRLMDIFT